MAKAVSTKIKDLVEGDAHKVEDVLTETWAKYLPNFEVWAAKQEATPKRRGPLADGLPIEHAVLE